MRMRMCWKILAGIGWKKENHIYGQGHVGRRPFRYHEGVFYICFYGQTDTRKTYLPDGVRSCRTVEDGDK